MSALLACPFCGGEAMRLNARMVTCSMCCVDGPQAPRNAEWDKEAEWTEAVRLWNKRSAPAPSVEACKICGGKGRVSVEDITGDPTDSEACPACAPTAAKGDELCEVCGGWRTDSIHGPDHFCRHAYRPKPSTTEPKP